MDLDRFPVRDVLSARGPGFLPKRSLDRLGFRIDYHPAITVGAGDRPSPSNDESLIPTHPLDGAIDDPVVVVPLLESRRRTASNKHVTHPPLLPLLEAIVTGDSSMGFEDISHRASGRCQAEQEQYGSPCAEHGTGSARGSGAPSFLICQGDSLVHASLTVCPFLLSNEFPHRHRLRYSLTLGSAPRAMYRAPAAIPYASVATVVAMTRPENSIPPMTPKTMGVKGTSGARASAPIRR